MGGLLLPWMASRIGDARGGETLPAAELDPTTISGLVAWYDFSLISTLWQDAARTSPITADAQAIAGVTDRSGSGNHLVEIGATQNPLYKTSIKNGRSVGRWDSSNDVLQLTSVITVVQFTIFIVATIPATGRTLFTNGVSGSNGYIQQTATGNRRMTMSGVANCTDDALTANFELWNWRHSTGATNFYLNGVDTTITSPTSNPLTPATSSFLGANSSAGGQALGGDICELLFYNSAIAEADRAAVQKYLNDRWAVY